MYWWNRFK